MAKSRRRQSKSGRTGPRGLSQPSATPPLQKTETPAVRPPNPAQPQRRSTYFEAVAHYEKGIDALQRHDYASATALLELVRRQFPEEKELQERVQLYLNVCRRQGATRRDETPLTVSERLYAATLALNGGRYDEAIGQLRLVRDEDPNNDHALYMLAVAHAQRGEIAEAVAHLERAIVLNPDNRGLARRDPDLEALRGDDAFRAVLEMPASPRVERRRTSRPRSGR